MKNFIHILRDAMRRFKAIWLQDAWRSKKDDNDLKHFSSQVEEQQEMMAQTIEKLRQQEKELEKILTAVTQQNAEVDAVNKEEAIRAAKIAETYKEAVNKLVAEYKAVWDELVKLKARNNRENTPE